MRVITPLLLGFGLALGPTAPTAGGQAQPDDTLAIYVIDVEGGEATLFVAPSGESLLVDTGWPGFGGRDADRIASAAADAGVTRIDHLIVTHFHTDHMGGAAQLAERLPIRTFIDHGTTVDQGERRRAAFDAYADLRRGSAHRVVAPGDRVPMDGVDIVILASGGAVLEAPLEGAGGANPYCEGFAFQGPEITSRYGNAEDDQSISAAVTFGRFRAVIMGDLNWNQEYPLMCPDNRIGPSISTWSPTTARRRPGRRRSPHAIAPRAAIMNNGPRKGGAPQTFEILGASPTLEHLWQNHYSIPAGDANRPERFIANLEEGEPLADGRPYTWERRTGSRRRRAATAPSR